MPNRPKPPPRNRPAGDLHSIDELAERWGVSTRTVQRQIKSGALRAHRIGRTRADLRRRCRGLP